MSWTGPLPAAAPFRHGRAGFPGLPPVGAHLVLEGALRQLVQLPAELVDLVVDAIHLGTELLVPLEVAVKILLVFLAGGVGRDRWVVAAGRRQEGAQPRATWPP